MEEVASLKAECGEAASEVARLGEAQTQAQQAHEAQVAVLREQPAGEEAEHVCVDRPVVALVDDQVGDAREVVGAV